MSAAGAARPGVGLPELIRGLAAVPDPVPPELEVAVTGVQMDNRMLGEGDLFIACIGRTHDAREYIDEAVGAGARAVLVETGGDWQGFQTIQGRAVLAVDDLSARISEIAARFYGRPSERLTVMGVTGTDGKTSISQFIAQALGAFGRRCGTIGTLGCGVYGALEETPLTTPDAVFAQRALAGMADAGIEPVVMEVTSVGLHQHRVDAVRFDTAVFTNVTRDHLDYHGSVSVYAETKKRLFTMPGLRRAIVNLDDPYAPTIINSVAGGIEILTYSVDKPIASVHAETVSFTRGGFEARVRTPAGAGRIESGLIGRFNLSNALAVVAALLGYLGRSGPPDLEAVCASVSALRPVDGRMQIVDEGADITAVVDYAHTPDGLNSSLLALKEHFGGNIWCVFGCGGNRDRGKRPLMGEIAERHAARLVLTDDNPRSEDGDGIVRQILSGVADRDRVRVIRDRAEAIGFAVARAAPGDVVLVAGKGHETYQEIGGNRMTLSDVHQVRLALGRRAGGDGP